jgi:HEAT repeats
MSRSIWSDVFRTIPFAHGLVLQLCARFNPDQLPQVLPLALGDKNPKVRYEAILVIIGKRLWSAIGDVVPLTRDANASVRLASIYALVQSGSPDVAHFIKRSLGDPAADVKVGVLKLLKNFPGTQYRSEVQRLVLDRDPGVKKSALGALLNIRSAGDFTPNLLDLGMDVLQPWEIQKMAFENIKQAEFLPVSLIPLILEDIKIIEDPAIHQEFAEILALFPPGDEMQRALIGLSEHILPEIRSTAITALGEKADRGAIYYLERVIREARFPSGVMLTENDVDSAGLAIQKIDTRHPIPKKSPKKGYK